MSIPNRGLGKSANSADEGSNNKKLESGFDDDRFVDVDDEKMKDFIKKGIKRHYIDNKPTRQQLYFLYKLILNRKSFSFSWSDFFKAMFAKMFCCCKLE